MKPGKRQRAILTAIQGGELRQEDGAWSIYTADGAWYAADRARCMALYAAGYIMADGVTVGGRIRYTLTEKGKRA